MRKGAWLGLADGHAVVCGDDFEQVAAAVVDRLLADGRETLTLLTGSDGPGVAGLVEALRGRRPEVEVDVQEGGQPHYALLLAAE